MQVGSMPVSAPNWAYFFASVNKQLPLPASSANQTQGSFPLEVRHLPLLGQCENKGFLTVLTKYACMVAECL